MLCPDGVWPDPLPQRAQLKTAPKPYETDPRAPEVTQNQNSAKNKNGIFGISASGELRKIIICHLSRGQSVMSRASIAVAQATPNAEAVPMDLDERPEGGASPRVIPGPPASPPRPATTAVGASHSGGAGGPPFNSLARSSLLDYIDGSPAPEDDDASGANRRLSLQSLTVVSCQVEVLFVLSALLSGKRKVPPPLRCAVVPGIPGKTRALEGVPEVRRRRDGRVCRGGCAGLSPKRLHAVAKAVGTRPVVRSVRTDQG